MPQCFPFMDLLWGFQVFSEEERMHRTSTVGSILNGVIMVGWLGFFLMGV